MEARTFWKTVTLDEANFLERLIAELESNGIRYCVVGGQAVNAYVDPLVSLDLAIAAADVAKVEHLLAKSFRVERFAHTINVSDAGSDLRAQLQTDPRYATFPSRSSRRKVLGVDLPVACLDDVLDGRVWAALDPTRRPSKRQKDLADISRLLERHPELRPRVPRTLLDRML